MKKPFNNVGVQALQAELYQLPDSQLLVQAQVIRTDFKSFIRDNFILDEKQSAFLDIIDQRMIFFLAGSTSDAVANRLEIKLIKEEATAQRDGDDDRKRKIIRPEDSAAATADSTGAYSASGELNVYIVYEEI